MKTKVLQILALAAMCAPLCGTNSYGQSSVPNTNALVIQAVTNATSANAPNLDISPEITSELLRAAASEIGSPEPGDHEDLLARHAALKRQILDIQQRHPRAASTNAPAAPAPTAAPAARPTLTQSPTSAPATSQAASLQPVGLKRRQPAASEQLARIISELSEIRAQLTDKVPTQVAQ